MSFTQNQLTKLPAPQVIEELDYEEILTRKIAKLEELVPEFSALVESDPAIAILEACAYDEYILRQRINFAVKSNMLAYAVGSDLDNIGYNRGVSRKVLVEEDLTANPQVEEVLESDEDYRVRINLAPEAYTSAGSYGAYTFFALSASSAVKDINVISPSPMHVDIVVLSQTTDAGGPSVDGVPDAALINDVLAATSADSVRPLCDIVSVIPAVVDHYTVEAELTFYPGPDQAVVTEASRAAVDAYVKTHHKLGHDITLSGLYAALQQPGVQNVNLISPSSSIVTDDYHANFCDSITLTAGGISE